MPRQRRSAVDLIVIIFSLVVAILVVAVGISVLAVEIIEPERDTADAVRGLTTIISSILSALLGVLVAKGLNGRDKDKGGE